jgi:hypothetical protein
MYVGKKVETGDALLYCILVAATHVKDDSSELMYATHSIHRCARMYTQAECGHYEHLL